MKHPRKSLKSRTPAPGHKPRHEPAGDQGYGRIPLPINMNTQVYRVRNIACARYGVVTIEVPSTGYGGAARYHPRPAITAWFCFRRR